MLKEKYPTERRAEFIARNKLIREMKEQGFSMAQIGRKYKLSRQRIHQILQGVDN